MVIKELILKNFGKFCGYSLPLQQGLTIIYGENESGKSTIHTFIKSMLFGLRKMRGRAAKTDVYTRYQPWENPSWYEGVLRFTCGGKDFRLERNFKAGEAQARLICESDGELLSVEDGDLDMLLGGISEAVYDNTVSIGQLKSRTGEALTAELQNYMSNYQGAGDGRLDLSAARKNLKEKKKKWKEKQEKRKKEEQEQEHKLLYEIQYRKEDIRNLKQKLEEQKEEQKEEQEEIRTVSEPERPFQIPLSVLAGAALLTGVAAGILIHVAAGILAGVIMVILLLLFNNRSGSRKQGEEKGKKEKKERSSVRFLKEQILEKQTCLENLQEELEELQKEFSCNKTEADEIKSIELAEEILESLVISMQGKADRRLKSRISELFSKMTGGKYRQVSIDENLQMDLFTEDRHIPLFMASTGTVEQVYLALRIAAGEILCEEETMPVLLDETFAMYDDRRLTETMKCLLQEKEQVLLFTCNKREINAFQEAGIPYHLIQL